MSSFFCKLISISENVSALQIFLLIKYNEQENTLLILLQLHGICAFILLEESQTEGRTWNKELERLIWKARNKMGQIVHRYVEYYKMHH